MKINHVDNTSFGIMTKPPVRRNLMHGCYTEMCEGKFKDYSFELYHGYRGDKKDSTLIIAKKSGQWIKSKLKYELLGKRKTIWYFASRAKEYKTSASRHTEILS